jgi:hypothetical protein
MEAQEVPSGQGGVLPSSADAIMRQHSSADADAAGKQENTVRNISSAENEHDEVSKIADELRHNLGMDETGKQVDGKPEDAADERPSDAGPKVITPNAAPGPSAALPVVDAPGPENVDDTIHIDREGNLIRKDDEKAS